MKIISSNRRYRRQFSRRPYLGALLAIGAVAVPMLAQEPSPNAPWPEAEKKGLWPKASATEAPVTTQSTEPVTTPPPTPANAVAVEQSEESVAAPTPLLSQPPKATMHQVSISGDYFLGQGDVTLPLGFSLAASGAAPPGYSPSVVKPDRDADYFGGTLSYSYGQSWFLDVGYSQGDSSGEVNANLGGGFTPPSQFTIDESAYQAYVRYVPKSLRGKRLTAYVRAGFSYVDSEMTDKLADPLLGFYQETVEATDILGNVGFGVGYRLYGAGRFRLVLQAEAEGFYGVRNQDLTESFPTVPLTLPTASIDNTLYGGIGRGTVRFEYRLGQSGLLRAFGDAGVQLKFTRIDYPSAPGFESDTFDELLWGPYAKLGISYSF